MDGKDRTLGRTFLPAWLALLAAVGGCGTPPATVELIAIARKALTDASKFDASRKQEALEQVRTSRAALDAAFDADARLIEAGKVTRPDGAPVTLSAEWVISARKGYAAAQDALSEQQRRTESAYATHLDNLGAAAEALDMAQTLIVEYSSLTGRAKQLLLSLQRRLFNERPEGQ